VKFHSFLTSPDFCGSEFMGESWTVHREVLTRLWDGDTDPRACTVARG